MVVVVLVVGADRTRFEVAPEVARLSVTLRNLMEDVGCAQPIPVEGVSSTAMARIVQWCTRYLANADDAARDVIREMTHDEIFDLMTSANYLDIEPLFDALCLAVADMIRGKRPEEIRSTFGIENDFTPEEEETVRRENAWAFAGM